jgi:hypothetical protein
MGEGLEFGMRAVVLGIGATLTMDLWALFLKHFFGISPLDYGLVGRWIRHLARGRFVHKGIAKSPPDRKERIVGWSAHYGTGLLFAALLLAICGLDWARRPTMAPALVFGVATLVFPFFIMQPGMGAGIAAAKTPRPWAARLRSLITHTVFGIGLYVFARLAALLT